jgi:hypothetical protein
MNVEAIEQGLPDRRFRLSGHKAVGDNNPGNALGREHLRHTKNKGMVEVRTTSQAELRREKLGLRGSHDLGPNVRRIGDDEVVTLRGYSME